MRVSPDGKNLASGDRDGNIRIYDLNDVNDIKLQRLIEAHDREVICLAYSPDMNESGDSRFWLASGSRDKNITLFDSEYNYEAVEALNHHSGTVTGLHFRDIQINTVDKIQTK
jgi:WD40 repeat protein